ncbi:MAG: hypothetical protein ACK56R_13150 [Pirellulaceae bacterium]
MAARNGEQSFNDMNRFPEIAFGSAWK